MKGAHKINEKRVEGGLAPMDIHIIGLAADMDPQRSSEEEEKVSSSNQRMRMLGTFLKPPVVSTDWLSTMASCYVALRGTPRSH